MATASPVRRMSLRQSKQSQSVSLAGWVLGGETVGSVPSVPDHPTSPARATAPPLNRFLLRGGTRTPSFLTIPARSSRRNPHWVYAYSHFTQRGMHIHPRFS